MVVTVTNGNGRIFCLQSPQLPATTSLLCLLRLSCLLSLLFARQPLHSSARFFTFLSPAVSPNLSLTTSCHSYPMYMLSAGCKCENYSGCICFWACIHIRVRDVYVCASVALMSGHNSIITLTGRPKTSVLQLQYHLIG